jgi:hypothetical protein
LFSDGFLNLKRKARKIADIKRDDSTAKFVCSSRNAKNNMNLAMPVESIGCLQIKTA